jgi:phosphoribosylformylglycinamidine synthase
MDHPKTKYLVDGVVAGIAGYGNCIGVPTIGGEMSFHPSYNGNCLVNVFNLGIVQKDRVFLGKAEGAGNSVMYVGAKTGRDGIHGATMASEEFDEDSEEKRPTVQVGDPFTEKRLLEACLELFKTDYVVGIQDMGAAGLTSSSFEMAGRAGTGVEMDLNKVPRREVGMTPYEIMLSESQERMLLVCRPGVEGAVAEIFAKWELNAEVVGKVTDDGMVTIKEGDEIAARLPAAELSETAPMYSRMSWEPEDLAERQTFDINEITEPEDLTKTVIDLVSSPNLCSREWIYQQFDHQVMTNTIQKPGSDASVIRIKGTDKAVAMSLDCNSRYCYLDPYTGGMQAVVEATRNVACSGAKPLAITDCLNFGSPERSDVMWSFIKAIEGMSEACKALNSPVISGNVSFYNQTDDQSVFPTPTVGAVGLLEDHTKFVGQHFIKEDDVIILLGETEAEIGGGEYLSVIHGIERGAIPRVDLHKEVALQKTMMDMADARLVSSIHDISDGGLAVCLCECLFNTRNPKPFGFSVDISTNLRADVELFSETQSRAVISVAKENSEDVLKLAKANGVPATLIGEVTSGVVSLKLNGSEKVACDSKGLIDAWCRALPDFM